MINFNDFRIKEKYNDILLIDNYVLFIIYIARYNLMQYFENDIYMLDKYDRFLENSYSNSR